MDLTRWMETLPKDVSSVPFPLSIPSWTTATVELDAPNCARTLSLRRVESAADCNGALAIYAARPSGPDALAGVKRVASFDEIMTPEEVGVAVFVKTHPGHLDVLDADASKRWVESALDDDADEIAVRLPGLDTHAQPLWNDAFAKASGDEDLLDSLALLWLPAPGAAEFRMRYRKIVADTIESAFLKPLRERADAQHKKLIIEVPSEADLVAQARSPYGLASRWFEHSDRPVVKFDGTAELPMRQAVSMARHMNRPGAAAECLDGRYGQAAPLAAFRRVAEHALACGASSIIPRPSADNVLADAKRTDGANNPLAPQQWKDDWLHAAHSLERLSHVLSQGRRITGILVINPADTLAALAPCAASKSLRSALKLEGKATDTAMQYAHPYNQLIDALAQFHLDFDVVDEETIERHGSSKRNAFQIGERAEYHLVIVPPSLSLRSKTLKLLKRFARHGGGILLVRPFAPSIDFMPDKALEKIEDQYPNVDVLERSGRDVCYQILRLNPHPFAIKASEGDTSALRMCHRMTETHELYFIANTHPDKPVESTVNLDADGAVRIADPWEPGIWLKDTDDSANQRTFRYNFQPGTADLFAIGGIADLTEAPHQRAPHTNATHPLAQTWEFLRLDPNLAPLHTCRAQMNGESLALVGSGVGRPGPTAFARVAVGEAVALSDQDQNHLALSFTFDSKIDGHERNIKLLLEPAPGLQVTLNGDPLEFDTDPESTLPGYLVADAAEALMVGENTLEIFMTLGREHAPLAPIESPVLAGDFAVQLDDRGEPTLDHEPDLLRNGDWAQQGYPYFAGTIQLHQTFDFHAEGHKRTFLHIPQPPFAASVRASVGEHDFADMTYAPHRLELTRRASEGDNALVVEITASRYNLFGPVYLQNRLTTPNPPAPRDFDAVPREDRKYWNRRPELPPFGLPSGLAIEVYDPNAPAPGKSQKKSPAEASDEEE